MSKQDRRKTFAEMYKEVEQEIRVLSRSPHHQIPGLTSDDVEVEMMVCLWKARNHYRKSKGTTTHTGRRTVLRSALGDGLMAYFWSIWLNRKADLIDYAMYQLRDYRKESVQEVSDTDMLRAFGLAVTPQDLVLLELPAGYTVTEQRVWKLIASGMDPVLVAKTIGRKTFEMIMEVWREDPTIVFLLRPE